MSAPSTSTTRSSIATNGAKDGEWRDISRHPSGNAPLAEDSGRRRRVELVGLLALTAVLYLWNLGASGYANDFYAAAVQAGTKSWKAFFFGSFDSSNFITVDKPPASLWPMELSGRIFGFNSWSMLAPQALMGVLTVWLLYATVRRVAGHRAGLVAGALLAITPVAVLMFRFNNPDALMTLLIVLAAYCVTRALEAASTRWLVLAGLVMGFSFLAKGLQPFTVLPALALAYLVAAPTTWLRRVLQLLVSGVAIVVGAGWWVLAVDLTPASDRPYIGGSGDNSALGLAFGYNGLSRISGGGNGPGGGGGGGGGFDGATGIGRMFNDLNGGQIAWLLPAALIGLVALLVITRRAPLTDRTRAAAIVWGGWLLLTGLVLSFASGIIHTYYTVELAPAVAALTALGATALWRMRHAREARATLSAAAVVTGIWTFALLDRTSSFAPWLKWLVLAAAFATVIAVVMPQLRRAAVVATVAGALVLGGGSAAYALDTATTAHTGSTPTAGPSTGGFGGGPGGFGGRRGGGFPGGSAGANGPGSSGSGGFPGGGSNGSRQGSQGQGGPSQGSLGQGSLGQGGPGGSGGFPGGGTGSQNQGGVPGGGEVPSGSGGTGSGSASGNRGSFGGGGGASANSALTALLEKTSTTWAAATIGSQSAGPLELASGKAVMAIGGFSGSDAAPTLAQFERYVAQGKIAYFVAGGMGGRGSGTGTQITQWVQQHYTATTVGGTTVYDLTKAKTS